MLDEIDRLAYLKDINTRREIESKSQITFGLGTASPLLAVNGSRPVFSGYSTQAQALYASTGGNLSTLPGASAAIVAAQKSAPANLQNAGILSWLKKTIGIDVNAVQSQIGMTGKVTIPDGLNVRTGAGTSFGKVTAIPQGSTFEIIGGVCSKDNTNNWLEIRLPNGKKGWISDNPEWISVGSLKTVPIVTSPSKEKTVAQPQKTVTQPAQVKQNLNLSANAFTNEILTKVAQNFPLENASQSYLNLGSGYHDGASYYAVDLNSTSGGDHDRGDKVMSVSKGTIIIGSEVISNGALRIQHTSNTDGKDFTWQSNYLHMPIFDTGKNEMVDVLVNGAMKKEERKIYEIRKQITTYDDKGRSIEIITTDKSDEMIKIWADKVVLDGEQIGYVGGRMAGNDTIDNAHLHFSTVFDKITVDLRTALESAGLKTFKAFDVNGTSRAVRWDEKLQSWVNGDEKLLLDRGAQETLIKGPSPYQSWRAWQDGKSVAEMEKVVWVETETLPDGTKIKVNSWLQANDYSQLWDPVQQKFVLRK